MQNQIMVITGMTRAGKSTALHNILSHILLDTWDQVIMLDGKGSELIHYADLPMVTYFGPSEVGGWAAALEAHAEAMPARYAALVERGLREAEAGDPRTLIIVDEVQKGTRTKKIGKEIGASLTLITEQSQALHDCVIMTTQRSVNAIPPSARENVAVWLSMLGHGYFHLKVLGTARSSGRTRLITPAEVLQRLHSEASMIPLSSEHLPRILGAKPAIPGRAKVTMYLGQVGSGRTHHLKQHTTRYGRIITLDCTLTHKKLLEAAIESGHAIAPPKATINDLMEIASLAIQAEETLVLLDNVERISQAVLPTLLRLIEVSAEVAIAAQPPVTDGDHKKLDHLISRSAIIEIKPLTEQQSRALIEANLPESVVDRELVTKHILRMAHGHPRTLINLAMQTTTGSMREVREFQAPYTQKKPLNLTWVPLLVLFFMFMLWRADGYMWTAAVMLGFYFIRRRITSSMRRM